MKLPGVRLLVRPIIRPLHAAAAGLVLWARPGPLRGGAQGGKLPRAPRQRRGPAIPQNDFLIAT